jgi:predicted NBD/HSP70 family sugar kinase
MTEPRTALGIDIGGTKVALVLMDADGAVVAERRLVNREYPDARALLEAVASDARELAGGASTGPTLEGVGVGICELVGLTGEVESSTTVPWARTDLEAALSGIGPVTLDADVRAAARAEAVFGAGRSFDAFGYVTVGTGISSTFVRDGEPWLGSHGAAQLLGTARLTLPCPHCGRMLDTSLEDVASGAGIVRRYGERSAVEVTGSEDVIEAARRGEEDAGAVLAEAADTLGSFIAFFLNLLDPDGIVIGGGLVSGSSPFRERAIAAGRSRIWAQRARSTPIVLGELAANAGAIGAAWSVLAGARTG